MGLIALRSISPVMPSLAPQLWSISYCSRVYIHFENGAVSRKYSTINFFVAC